MTDQSRRLGAVAAALSTIVLGAVAARGAVQEPQSSQDQRFREIPNDPSTGTPKPLERAPSTISLLEADELEALGVRFFTDTLRRLPGLEITRLSSTESNVSLRGYNDDSSASQGILALVDGRQVYNEFFGSVVWDSIPISLDDIERIEMIRGPGSFIHGPNAMHGFVNIVSRSPLAYKNHDFHLSGGYGSYQSTVGTLVYVRKERDSGIKTVLGWDDINEFQPSHENSKDKKFVELRYEYQLNDKAENVPNENPRIDVALGINEQQFNVLIPSLSVLPPTEFTNEIQEGFARATFSWMELRARVSWTHFLADSLPENSSYSPFETTLDTADVDLQYSVSAAKTNIFTAGTGYRFAAFTTEDLDVSGGRHKTGLIWGYLQDELQLGEDLWLTGGVRLDHHSIVGTSTSPRLAAVWEVAQDNYLRASAGSGFRSPSLREIWFGMPVLGGFGTIAGNRDLKAEQVRSFELSYSGRPAERLRVQANVFYNLVDRLVEFHPSSPTVFGPRNAKKEEAYGFELEAEHTVLKEVSLFANYAFGARQERDTNDRNPSAPRHKANGGARWNTPWGLNAMIWVHFFDNVELSDPTGNVSVGAVDEYALLNARVSYRFNAGEKKEASLFLQAFNLLDHDHREHPEGDSYGMILMGGAEFRW